MREIEISLEISISVLVVGAQAGHPYWVLLQATSFLPSHLLGTYPGSAKGISSRVHIKWSLFSNPRHIQRQASAEAHNFWLLPYSTLPVGCVRRVDKGWPFRWWDFRYMDLDGLLGL